MLGETGFEEKYGLNISATYCFTITYIVIKKESHLPVTLPPSRLTKREPYLILI